MTSQGSMNAGRCEPIAGTRWRVFHKEHQAPASIQFSLTLEVTWQQVYTMRRSNLYTTIQTHNAYSLLAFLTVISWENTSRQKGNWSWPAKGGSDVRHSLMRLAVNVSRLGWECMYMNSASCWSNWWRLINPLLSNVMVTATLYLH